MNLLNPAMTSVEWHAALTASEQLWPEPCLAPEVPGEGVLARYLETGPAGFRPPWLREQIEESAACQRALEDLRLRRRLGRQDHLAKALEQAGFRLASEPRAAPAPQPVFEHRPIGLGDLRRTEQLVFVFAGDSLSYRQTFRPLLVAVVEGPSREGEQEFWRGIVCTPASAWPEENLAEDEILVRSEAGHDYVAHLWLEFPVSVLQFAAKLSALEPRAVENLQFARAARAEGLPVSSYADEESERVVSGCRLDPLEDAPVLRQRAQLHDCAVWLSATLDAQIAYDEWKLTAWPVGLAPAESSQPVIELARVYEALPVAAAGGPSRTPCLEWAGPLQTFPSLFAAAQTAVPRETFTAECLMPPEPDSEAPGLCRAQWSLDRSREHLAGRRFAVFCLASGRLLGSGSVRSQGAGLPLVAELTGALWGDFDRVRLSQLVLLFPSG